MQPWLIDKLRRKQKQVEIDDRPRLEIPLESPPREKPEEPKKEEKPTIIKICDSEGE